MDIEEAWNTFMEEGDIDIVQDINDNKNISTNDIPKASDLYISTKTKIIYLNKPIDLYDVFWKINILPYDTVNECIIKKQIKIISNSNEELNSINMKLSKYKYYNEHIITHLEQHQSDVSVYKDVRKITIGISQKDLLSYRCKQKSAFYNCFVIIIRLYSELDNRYKEIHVKIFNTGKIEIPGVQNDAIFDKTCNFILSLLNNITDNIYCIHTDKTETILINSNFNSGFCINRQQLFNILRSDYNLNVSYDPCSYPGIQCKYKQDDSIISFMIFRTGSILIVGKCDDEVIVKIYEFLKNMLRDEYFKICEPYDKSPKQKDKVNKPRKKIIFVDYSVK